MPVWLIPLIVQVGSKVIEMAFKAVTKKSPTDQIVIFQKIEKKDKAMSQKLREWL